MLRALLLLWVALMTTTYAAQIKIGAILPLSGPAAHYGEELKRSIEMAIEELGDVRHDYKLVFEDDQYQPKQGVLAFRRLVDIEKCSAVIVFGSGQANAIKPLADANRVPVVSLSLDTSVADGGYSFVIITPPYKIAEAFAEVAKRKGYERIVTLCMRHQGFMQCASALEANWDSQKIKTFYYAPSETDFRSLILKAQQQKPDLWVIAGAAPSNEILTAQLRQTYPDGEISALESFNALKNLSLVEGAWYVGVGQPEEAFLVAYEERFGMPIGFLGGNAYDGFNILVELLRAAGPAVPLCIARAFAFD